eukprot:TRINITY_DN3788_c0_g1_i1.p2 TRINITY_DN3788_c0_g1~~TRINITY_DN3788_c0_g1_i1.p2  ORF type:complete len:220 (+),score=40.60 TRINITY_DN3788_c0_g1_i1:49-660(+)
MKRCGCCWVLLTVVVAAAAVAAGLLVARQMDETLHGVPASEGGARVEWPIKAADAVLRILGRFFDNQAVLDWMGKMIATPPEATYFPQVVIQDVKNAEALLPAFRLFYSNASKGAPLPVVVYFHGGGFLCASAFDALYQYVGERLAAEGFAVFSVEYCKVHRCHFPAPINDASAVLDWCAPRGKTHCPKFCRLCQHWTSHLLL